MLSSNDHDSDSHIPGPGGLPPRGRYAHTVGHFVKRYLDPTCTWIHGLISNQRRWRTALLSDRLNNQRAFPVPRLRSLALLPLPSRMWNGVSRRVTGYAPAHLRALDRDSVELLHAHFGQGGVRALPLARAAGLPLVCTFYGADLSLFPARDPRWRRRYDLLFDYASRLLVEGPHMRERLIQLGCPPEKAVLQKIGVDLSAIPFAGRASDSGEMRVLICARFVEKKGVPDAVLAFALAAMEEPRIQLTIIGDAGRGTAQQLIAQKVREIVLTYRISSRVRMLGSVPYQRLISEYARHHIFLAASHRAANGDTEGGSPVTLTEAIASGMPVVSTRHCDIPELVSDGLNGFLVDEHDVEEMAHRIVWLARNPEHWAQMGEAGRQVVAANHDVRKLAARAERLYDAVIAPSGVATG